MSFIDLESIDSFPVLGPRFTKSDFLPIDLSVNNKEIKGLDVVDGLASYIDGRISLANKKIAIGGYGEERDFYWSSSLFINDKDKRTIHLGTDLWIEPMQAIYAPLDGQIHSLKYNNQPLDYGYTVLLKHSHDDQTFYSLYGHLSDKGFEELEVGQIIKKGEVFSFIGHPSTNGGWAPHLHLQTIIDLGDHIGDYPGVCTKTDANYYLDNCPNPSFFIF